MALKRLYSMERKFSTNPILKTDYNLFLQEYHSLGHMTKIPQSEILRDPGKTFYLPHHAVLKESSSTTKLRVVFDGSSKSTNGISLNDILDPGPPILQDLFSILIRFRKHRIGLASDVEKMFRQILVNESQRDLQRIVWRESEDLPISHFWLNTVTYGTASATFLAVRTLHQIANDLPQSLADISQIIKSDFYVDDLISGADSVDEARTLQKQMTDALITGGFKLRKWVSNDPQVLVDIPESEKEKMIEFDTSQSSVKTLGLIWLTQSDAFAFNVNAKLNELSNTKRSLLSTAAAIFDPLGFLSPSTVMAKMMFQSLWLHKLDWDDPLPPKLNADWQNLRSTFHLFNQIKIPRFLSIPNHPSKMELHVFSDSSEKAFSAVASLRSVDNDNNISVSLITAKTKVAPLKTVTLPRLELCGAVLAVKLILKVKHALGIENVPIFGWTDSSIVLAWLSQEPIKWKCFVANRTSYILQHLPRQNWEHVPSELNPADCASRGLMPYNLLNFDLWWNGPAFLKCSPQYWPKLSNQHDNNFSSHEMEPKKSPNICAFVETVEEKFSLVKSLFDKFSTFSFPTRVLAQCIRYMENLHGSNKSIFLTAHHTKLAAQLSIRWSQSESFQSEIDAIKKGRDLPSTSKLKMLSPFIDQNGILRVGGRIENSPSLSFDVKHPIILDKEHDFTVKLLHYLHKVHLHPTQQQLAVILRQSYWVVGANIIIRKINRSCEKCKRYSLKTSQQRMADLPKFRVQPSRPFSTVGVDFAGPVKVKSRAGRGGTIEKGYIAVFVCLVVKAIHVELVSGLSTNAFIACLRRFISRRGYPHAIYSDNGSNFIGTEKRLRKLHDVFSQFDEEAIHQELSPHNIQWHFIPPSSPHFGGMWEAGVKSIKRHLVRTIGEASLTFEGYSTILSQIECLLNSRPIAPMLVDGKETGDILTPGHFIMGSAPLMLPDPPDDDRSITNRWQLWQNIMKGFWKTWRMDYLTMIQRRGKWQNKSPNLNIGDIVLLKDSNTPPGQWPKGIVTTTHPGKDGLVRVVTIKTMKGAYKRPVTTLCPLKLVKEYNESLNGGEHVSVNSNFI